MQEVSDSGKKREVGIITSDTYSHISHVNKIFLSSLTTSKYPEIIHLIIS